MHAVATEELPTVEGTPTECGDIVPDDETTEDASLVTCPACHAVTSAKNAGRRARSAIRLGEQSGIFRDAAAPPKSNGTTD